MNYTKTQKTITYIVLFCFFFTFIFKVPPLSLFYTAEAESKPFFNVVSLIVNEDVYDDSDVKSKIKRYASDIQSQLENTKVIIFPTPKTVTAFDIASLNENLYFEGYKGLNKNSSFNSKLIGTVLIGKLPLAVVYDHNKVSKSILPYVDFEDKLYIFDHKTNKFELGNGNQTGLKAEIWHGVISPNTGDKINDINKIKDYFDKNHEFYVGEGNFKTGSGIINGKKDEPIPNNYEPYVFYFDQFRESKSVSYSSYKEYESYLENREDLTYNRFTKELSKKLKDKIVGDQTDTIKDLLGKVDTKKVIPPNVLDNVDTSMDNIADIQSMKVINKSVKKFIEIFNGPTLGKFTENVHNAGRYNPNIGKKNSVNVDMIPTIISTLDLMSDEVVKNVNTDIESYIDNLVKTKLSKQIPIYTNIEKGDDTFTNFFYGRSAESISGASECSIYLGSNKNGGKLVEANRAYNIKNIQSDVNECGTKVVKDTNGRVIKGISGLWGGNSPLNIVFGANGSMTLGYYNLYNSTRPLFDIAGSRAVEDDLTKNIKEPSPLDCFNHNFIKTGGDDFSTTCETDNSADGMKINPQACNVNGCPENNYKWINSWIEHKSPTQSELATETSSMITQSLPIDKIRYIDFIGKDGLYHRIDYQNGFKFKTLNNELVTEESIKKSLLYNLKQESIKLTALSKSIGVNETVDLENYLKSKLGGTYKLSGDEKEISYYDTLAFSLYWNKISSVSAKYKFVMENYLTDQFSSDQNNFYLPRSKKLYEIAYLGAKGDSSNMYVKLDPEEKGENPYADIIGKNMELTTFLNANKLVDTNNNKEGTFKCGPPEGVPIWQWLGAISCWLKDMLPPKVSISDGSCGVNLLENGKFTLGGDKKSFTPQEKSEIEACSGDVNKNGINDCIESKLTNGSISLSTDSLMYDYNKKGELKAFIKDKDGNIVKFDNSTKISFEVSKIEIANNIKEELTPKNSIIVYDRNALNEKSPSELKKYLTFSDSSVPVTGGVANYLFSTKGKDADITFRAFISIDSDKGQKLIELDSITKVSIRGGILFIDSNKITSDEEKIVSKIGTSGNSIKVSDATNIYLVDSQNLLTGVGKIKNTIKNNSSSKEKLVLGLNSMDKSQTRKSLSYPLTVKLFNGAGSQILENISVQSGDLLNFKPLISIHKAGIYKIEIIDRYGFKASREIQMLPDDPNHFDIKLGSSIVQTGNNISTHLISIYDKFGNLTSGDLYKINVSIDGDGVEFINSDAKKTSIQTFEGYSIFRLKSTTEVGINTLRFTLNDSSGHEITGLKKDVKIKTISNVKLNIVPLSGSETLKVGGRTYNYKVSLLNENNKILAGFNSRSYLVINPIYGEATSSYIDIKNGVGILSFTTTKIAGKQIPIEFQVEGMNGITKINVDILPELPLKMDLNLSKTKIEASNTDFSILTVELKDRYGNLVFNDNSTKVTLDIDEKYQNIISVGDLKTAGFVNGKTTFKIYGQPTPGTAYFKLSTNPTLSKNSIDIIGQSSFSGELLTSISGVLSNGKLTSNGKQFYYDLGDNQYRSKFETEDDLKKYLVPSDLEVMKNEVIALWKLTNKMTLNGVGEAAGQLETFYFWNKNKLEGTKYNSLYTSLLGASYGDITQVNYLAGALLFDRGNRSLAVTSLLNDVYDRDDVINIKSNGGINSVYKNTDLTQDLNYMVSFSSDNKLYLDIFNDSNNTYLGKILYNFNDNLELKPCISKSNDFNSCNISKDKSSILMKSLDKNYKVLYSELGFDLVNNFDKKILSISKNGEIKRFSNIGFEMDKNNKNSYLVLNIKSGKDNIGSIAINLVNSKIDISRDEKQFSDKLKLSTFKNDILVFLSSNLYGTRELYGENDNSMMIYYSDPFGTKTENDYFSKDDLYSLEKFSKQDGIGWELFNKYLLLFASGDSVGNSTKNYQSFSMINLGDPVISLKSIKKKLPRSNPIIDRSFDSTIGKLLSSDKDINGYRVLDYNGDSRKDILLIKEDGKMKLLENKSVNGNFIDIGNLAFISDLGNKDLILAGNFDGDKYGDVFFVNDKGKAGLLKNYNKVFKRISIDKEINPPGKIIQARVYDMDADGIDDIITFDDFGSIYIFYGTYSGKFISKEVAKSSGLKIDSESRNDNGLVYFQGLHQPSKDTDISGFKKESEDLLKSLNTNQANGASTYKPQDDLPLSDSLLDRSIFEEVLYDDGGPVVNQSISSSIPDLRDVSPNTPEVADGVEQTKIDLEELKNGVEGSETSKITIPEATNATKTTNFIKSEYSSNLGLEVSKNYINKNGDTLKSGDTISVKINLTNNSGKTLNKVAYLETIPQIFKLNEETIKVTGTTANIKEDGVPGYDFLVDGFSIGAGQTITIVYSVTTLGLKYGHIQVGLFENGETISDSLGDQVNGDDKFGDIILKPNNQNCGENVVIYRSIEKRDYKDGTKQPSCDDGKVKLPDDVYNNIEDNDKNGVPDYIDKLKDGSNTQELTNYSNKSLTQLNKDTDLDGVPDSDDNSPDYNSEKNGGIMGALAGINQKIDDISAGIDETVEGLCNGFGGGNCISLPLNWAPLAPGGDPTAFGFPIGDGLNVGEGLPIFSWPTIGFPPVWPPSPLGAGGRLDISPTGIGVSQFRVFVTPTLTLGMGAAFCFGSNALSRVESPMGISPLIPGGNCIVAAAPLPLCSDDGSDGDPESVGFPDAVSITGGYGVINGNCSKGSIQESRQSLNKEIADEYLKSKRNPGYKPKYDKKYSTKNGSKGIFSSVNNGKALLNMNSGGGEGDMEIGVDVDTSAILSGNFSDVIKIKQTRVWAFPDFLMNWVTRQIEEIANKLTDFPTIYVILPDFSGIFDGDWMNFGDKLDSIYEGFKSDSEAEKADIQDEIDSVNESKVGKDCSTFDLGCHMSDLKTESLNLRKDLPLSSAKSGISAVYDYLSNIPIIKFSSETVNVNIPWIDPSTIDKTIFNWEITANQWEDEINRVSDSWSLGLDCGKYSNQQDKSDCERDNGVAQKFLLNARGLVGSLRKNIDVLNDYKKFPEKINKMLNIKEVRLGQILCNIETISTLTGGRIGKNGKRFKAWVQLYVLIKAILKSWQLLIDIFLDYEAECQPCKNERYDLMYFIWKLISMIIPEIPVIQFPKWPDIIIDLHNVRVGLDIHIPEFSFNLRPIILPTLPNLHLPDFPNFGLKLPKLPILPALVLPTLPDLPTLPKIELPDLPPPPKLPKILGAFKMILNILKLVTKIMCILRSNPFIPEWRAGDQISFLTEGAGFNPLDYIDISLPQFSLPFIDAIEIKTFVNLEFGTDFLVEMARTGVAPLNYFTNNIVHMLDISHGDLDFRGGIPSNVDVNINNDGSVDNSIGMDNKLLKVLVLGLSKKFNDMVSYIDENKDIKVSNNDFISIVNLALSSKEVTKNPKSRELTNLWKEVSSMTYSKEDKKIKELEKNNREKFYAVKNILNTEIELIKRQKLQLKNNYLDIRSSKSKFIEVSSNDEINTKIKVYNEKIRPYNYNFIKSAQNLVKDKNEERAELKKEGEKVVKKVKSGIENFNKGLLAYNEKLLADIPTPISKSSSPSLSMCQAQAETDYKYQYEGLYVIESDKHYRLFDYISELTGDEETTTIDYDLDGDDDLLYMVNNELFLKQNLSKEPNKDYVSDTPIIVFSDDNKFFNGKSYLEGVNYFREGENVNGYINYIFNASTDNLVNNYRIETYKNIDQIGMKKSIIDSFSSIDKITIDHIDSTYTVRNNIGYINNIGSTSGLELKTKSLINIADDIRDNKVVNLLEGNNLYAGSNNFTINYIYGEGVDIKLKNITVKKYQNIVFNKNIKIMGISGDAYIQGIENISLYGGDIRQYFRKPIFPGTKIIFQETEKTGLLSEKSHIEINYYDRSSLPIDFREVSDYTLYDLGEQNNEYSINLDKINGYYYSKILSFKDNLLSTYSNAQLFSPQKEADKNPPKLTINSIKVPVYQPKDVNLTSYLYEDSGFSNIKSLTIDSDLEVDSDGDGDPKNDVNSEGFKVLFYENNILIRIDKMDTLINRNIGITITDTNGNIGYYEVPFEVYSPIPEIESYVNGGLKGRIVDTINLENKLNGEPVNLYRYRAGSLEKVKNNTGGETVYSISGGYSFVTNKESNGLSLRKGDVKIASINENTGLITLEIDNNTIVKVVIDKNYPELVINYNSLDIYSQTIKFIKSMSINDVLNFDNMKNEGIYVKLDDISNYEKFIVPKGVTYNPGAYIIYKKTDINNTPILAIFEDGRINISSDYKLEYSNLGKYIVLNVVNKYTSNIIAKILYNVDLSYVLK